MLGNYLAKKNSKFDSDIESFLSVNDFFINVDKTLSNKSIKTIIIKKNNILQPNSIFLFQTEEI